MSSTAETASNARVRPKDASSLILYRRSKGGAVEVLMGRRHTKHSFVPGYYVFPGGRVDAADARAIPARPMRSDVLSMVSRSCSTARARALAMAAVRETFEETGLILGGAIPDPASNPRQPAAWSHFLDTGKAADLGNLDYVARAITPAQSPIRFDGRFFVTDGERAEGELGGSGELEELAWRSLADTMSLPLVDITEFLLGEYLPKYLDAPASRDPNREIAFFHFIRGRSRVSRG